MNTPKYTVKEIDSTIVLFVNNKPSECPFKTGLAGFDGFQRPLLIQPHCNSQCPHFSSYNTGDDKVQLTCGDGRIIIVEVVEQTPELKILKP